MTSPLAHVPTSANPEITESEFFPVPRNRRRRLQPRLSLADLFREGVPFGFYANDNPSLIDMSPSQINVPSNDSNINFVTSNAEQDEAFINASLRTNRSSSERYHVNPPEVGEEYAYHTSFHHEREGRPKLAPEYRKDRSEKMDQKRTTKRNEKLHSLREPRGTKRKYESNHHSGSKKHSRSDGQSDVKDEDYDI
jgi:hypothetical protein